MAAKQRINYSTFHPRELPRRIQFWFYDQLATVGIIVLSILIGFALFQGNIIPLSGLDDLLNREFTAEALSLSIQFLIVSLGMIAFGRGIKTLARLTVEHDFAESVAERCQKELRKMRETHRATIELTDVPRLWPKNPERGLAALRLCEAIHDDAMDSHFGSKEAMLQHYRDESTARVALIQNMQRASLHLGILGTFLGLAYALPLMRIAAGAESDFNQLFAYLQVCFLTSVMGLVVALLIGLLTSLLFRQQERFFERLEEEASAMLGVVRKALNREALPKTFDQLNNSVRELYVEVQKQTQRLNDQNLAIADGLDALKVTKSDFDTLVAGVESLKEKVLANVDEVSDRISSPGFLTQIERNVGKSVDALLRGVDESIEPVRESFGTLHAAVSSLNDAAGILRKVFTEQTAQSRQIEDALRGTQGDIAAAHSEHLSAMRREREQVLAQQQEFHQVQEADLEKSLQQRQQQVALMNDFLSRIRKFHLGKPILDAINEGNQRTVTALKEGFSQINDTLGKAPASKRRRPSKPPLQNGPPWYSRWFSRKK